MIDWQKAEEIASTADVATPKDCAVVYSVSFLPTKENRDKAMAYVANTAEAMTIEQTECGKKLLELGLGKSASNEDEGRKMAQIWSMASVRYIAAASGNITAFVSGADPRSVFMTTELPAILRNPAIYTINNIEKHRFRV